jgi:hypothetical protein
MGTVDIKLSGISERRFDMGRVVRSTFRVFRSDGLVFFILAIALSGVPHFALGALISRPSATWLAAHAQSSIPMYFRILVSPWHWVREIIGTGISSALNAVLVYLSLARLGGLTASVPEALRTGVRVFPVVWIVTFLLLLVTATPLAIIGFVFALGSIAAVPVAVAEGNGVWSSFGRSLNLTRGHRWTLLGLSMCFILADVALDQVERRLVPTAALSGGLSLAIAGWMSTILFTVVGSMVAAINAIGIASIYFELKLRKEGLGPETLADVFA